MAKRSKKRRRKRLSGDQVRRNAQQGSGGAQWLTLPAGVKDWTPDKAGRYILDILPYEVSDEHHPDGVEPGYLWYKRQFTVHHNVGAEESSVVCPRSAGQRCPICDYRDKLGRDANEDTIKSLKGQKYVMMNMRDPEDEDSVVVFLMSYGKFFGADAGLQKEILEGDEEILNFFDTEGGKTLKVRFSEESYMGRKFLRCTRIDFKDRPDLDEDETLEKTVNLDECLNVMPYEKLKSLFLQLAGDAEPDEDDDEDEEEAPKRRKRKPKPDPEPDDDEDEEDEEDEEEDEEDEDDDEEDEEPEPPPKKKRKVKKKTSKKKASKGKKKCPAGGTFGKDFDTFDECDDCPAWDDCEEASDL